MELGWYDAQASAAGEWRLGEDGEAGGDGCDCDCDDMMMDEWEDKSMAVRLESRQSGGCQHEEQ